MRERMGGWEDGWVGGWMDGRGGGRVGGLDRTGADEDEEDKPKDEGDGWFPVKLVPASRLDRLFCPHGGISDHFQSDSERGGPRPKVCEDTEESDNSEV